MLKRELIYSGIGLGHVKGSCEHSNEELDSMKCSEVLHQLKRLVAPQEGLGWMELVILMFSRLPTKAVRVGFVVDKAALGQVLSQYFGFLYHLFHRLLHTHHPSSRADTIGQMETYVPTGLSLTPPQEIEKRTVCSYMFLP
jgi:hypothetical protein